MTWKYRHFFCVDLVNLVKVLSCNCWYVWSVTKRTINAFQKSLLSMLKIQNVQIYLGNLFYMSIKCPFCVSVHVFDPEMHKECRILWLIYNESRNTRLKKIMRCIMNLVCLEIICQFYIAYLSRYFHVRLNSLNSHSFPCLHIFKIFLFVTKVLLRRKLGHWILLEPWRWSALQSVFGKGIRKKRTFFELFFILYPIVNET